MNCSTFEPGLRLKAKKIKTWKFTIILFLYHRQHFLLTYATFMNPVIRRIQRKVELKINHHPPRIDGSKTCRLTTITENSWGLRPRRRIGWKAMFFNHPRSQSLWKQREILALTINQPNLGLWGGGRGKGG